MRPNFPYSSVKADAGNVAGAVGRGDAESSTMPEDEIQEIAMGDFHTFWLPRGSRRIYDVGKILAAYLRRRRQAIITIDPRRGCVEIDGARSDGGGFLGERAARNQERSLSVLKNFP